MYAREELYQLISMPTSLINVDTENLLEDVSRVDTNIQ